MRLLLLAFVAPLLSAQVYTPPVQPTAAVPGKMVAPAGSGATGTSCTFIGNAVPATAVIINCTLGTQVLISSVTVPISSTSSIAVTLQINSGAGLATANTVMISATPATSGITVSATVNGGTAVTGSF